MLIAVRDVFYLRDIRLVSEKRWSLRKGGMAYPAGYVMNKTRSMRMNRTRKMNRFFEKLNFVREKFLNITQTNLPQVNDDADAAEGDIDASGQNQQVTFETKIISNTNFKFEQSYAL